MPTVNTKTNLLAFLQSVGYIEPGLPGMEGKRKGICTLAEILSQEDAFLITYQWEPKSTESVT